MDITDLRRTVAEIRREIIQKQSSRYGLFASIEAAESRMSQLWDDSKSFEYNALVIYQEFYKKNDDLRFLILEAAEKRFVGKHLNKRKQHEIRRSIYQSCDQAGKRCCGHNIELFISFILNKAGIRHKRGEDRHDIVIFRCTKKWHRSWVVGIKHTVREKSNDNEFPIKFVWGFPNNPYGGFTRQGFENWTKDKGHIRIVVNPEGRSGAKKYADILGIDVDILSLDDGLEAIKNLD